MSLINLKPHQKFIANKIGNSNQKGILLFHGLGSGKTITGLAISALYPNRDVVIICPVGVRKNFEDDIVKLGFDRDRFAIFSYESYKIVHSKSPEYLKIKF